MLLCWDRLKSGSCGCVVKVKNFLHRCLQENNTYILRARGEIEVKGKGKMSTYFLVGTTSERVKEPDDEFLHLPMIGQNGDITTPTFPKNKPRMKEKSTSGTCAIL